MGTDEPGKIGRRDLLKGAIASSVTLASGSRSFAGQQSKNALARADSPADSSLIRRENEKPGARDWQLTRVRINRGPYRTSLIEGYCSHQSIGAGEKLSLFASTDPARRFTIDIYVSVRSSQGLLARAVSCGGWFGGLVGGRVFGGTRPADA